MEEKKFVVVLSDIHIGTNVPTVWYCKEIHEKYLVTILNDIINCANQIQEVILLGDIFEFWSYPPNEMPPTIDDIIEVNPNILGPHGKLRQALSALEGRMVFIPGDHDMNVTQAELNKITIDGFFIKFHYGAYTPYYATNIKFIHGHEFTILNAPYFASKLAPLPIGYFVCRAMAYKVQTILNKSNKQKICNLEDYGADNYYDFLPKLSFYYEHFEEHSDVISSFVNAIMDSTGIPGDLPIQVNRFNTISLNEVKLIYQKKELAGQSIELKDIINDYFRKNLPESIKKHCFDNVTDIVVMGHTHAPMIFNNKKKHYINTGFMCPNRSKLETTPITYGVYNLSKKEFNLVKATGDSTIHILPYDNNNTLSSNHQKSHNTSDIKMEQNPPPAKIFTFGWSVFNLSQEFWVTMQAGVLSKADELGINVLTHDEKDNTIEMITGSIDLISKGIDALLIAPVNPELLPAIVANAKKFEVPVVVIDIGTGGADVVAFIISDNFGGGILAGEYALNLIDKYSIKSRNIAIIQVQVEAKYAKLRGEGFKSVMLEKGYQVVADVVANSDELQAYIEMKKILATYKDNLAVVFCANGTMAIGAARAIDEEGKKGVIMLIGFDAGPNVIAAIKKGDLQGSIAQQPFRMGEIGVEIANAFLLGNPITYDDWSEKKILMEVFLVDETGEVIQNIV